MNNFTTEHPLSAESPRSGASKELASVLTVALVLFPFLLGLLWFMNLMDNQDMTDYTPDPFGQVFMGAVVVSLVVGLVVAALYRLGKWIFTRHRAVDKLKRA